MIELIVLGAGGAIPTPTHGPAAYWLRLDGHPLLVDPGPGALVRLLRHPDGPRSLDEVRAVLVSHLHLDHCADLAPLLFALHSPVLAGERPLQLLGPAGLREHLDALRGVWGASLQPARRELRLTELAPGDGLLAPAGEDGDWVRGAPPGPGQAGLTVYLAAHAQSRGESLLFRFADAQGQALAYGGDGAPSQGLRRAAEGVDLLVVECSTPDEWEMDGHMSPRRVAALAAEARPRRIVLTHQYPPAAAADLPAQVRRAGWAGPVVAAVDGTTCRVPA